MQQDRPPVFFSVFKAKEWFLRCGDAVFGKCFSFRIYKSEIKLAQDPQFVLLTKTGV